MPKRHEITYVILHDKMPEHPKIAGLSDAAFRALIEGWCYCSRHLTDGRVPPAIWRRVATKNCRAELEDAGLVVAQDGAVLMHDYLDMQRSAAEVEAARAQKAAAGARGNHNRWHVALGVVDPDCRYCYPDIANGIADAIAGAIPEPSHRVPSRLATTATATTTSNEVMSLVTGSERGAA